ncbi:hypothetical protein [Mycobacterium sp. NPDC050853]|uniref:hypothetical protein n=1 Tax=Mycobacteriaceae TaxID=1762 RepID=UPI0015DE658C|nr:hypothetical protein [Mycobacteroides sp. LB1]
MSASADPGRCDAVVAAKERMDQATANDHGGKDTAAVVKRFRNRAAIVEQAARETTDPEIKAEAQNTADTINRAADYFGARQFDDLQVLIENCDGACHVWSETISSLANLYSDCDA